MEANEETLNQIEELAKLPGMNLSKLSLYFKLSLRELKELFEKVPQFQQAWDRGRLIWEIKYQKVIDRLSDQGSGPAQTLLLQIKRDAEVQELQLFYKDREATAFRADH